jgi:hypothetical protein
MMLRTSAAAALLATIAGLASLSTVVSQIAANLVNSAPGNLLYVWTGVSARAQARHTVCRHSTLLLLLLLQRRTRDTQQIAAHALPPEARCLTPALRLALSLPTHVHAHA